MYSVTLRHNFETAHRLSHHDAPEKCQSIHGHSWWASVTIEGERLDSRGMLVEFGAFKKVWRAFLDTHVDHHLALKEDDPLGAAILSVMPEARVLFVPFDPTTENMARWLFDKSRELLSEVASDEGLRVVRLHVQETGVNAASFEV